MSQLVHAICTPCKLLTFLYVCYSLMLQDGPHTAGTDAQQVVVRMYVRLRCLQYQFSVFCYVPQGSSGCFVTEIFICSRRKRITPVSRLPTIKSIFIHAYIYIDFLLLLYNIVSAGRNDTIINHSG